MNPLREGYYGYKLVKALAVAGISFAILLADCLTGFKRIDTFGRWAGLVLGSLATATSIYYWRKLGREDRRRRHRQTGDHSGKPESAYRPIAALPPRHNEK